MSFGQPLHQQRRAAVPLAPILDVLFLLLIFFVTTSSFRAEEQQIDVNLPAAEAAEDAEPDRTEVIINVRDDGTLLIGSTPYEPEELRGVLGRIVADYPDEHVIIRGDQDVNYGRIVSVMDTARAAGVRNILFATVKQAEDVGG